MLIGKWGELEDEHVLGFWFLQIPFFGLAHVGASENTLDITGGGGVQSRSIWHMLDAGGDNLSILQLQNWIDGWTVTSLLP